MLERVDAAVEEQFLMLLGLRRRTQGDGVTGLSVWRSLLETFEENSRDSIGTGQEDYWRACAELARRKLNLHPDALIERRFT